jgi:Tol biopolymer transport system component
LKVLYQIPVLGGAPRKVVTDVGLHVAFSPQGDRFSFVRSETSLMVANSDGRDIRMLAQASPGDRWLVSAWSPDSTKVAAAVFSAADSKCHLFEVDIATGAMRPISGDPWLTISGLNWLPDGSGLVLTGRDLETEISQVWFVSYPGGVTERITNDLSNYLGLSVSADGKTIASVKEDRLANIWTAGTDEGSEPVRVTGDLARDDGMSGVAWTADGRIVYTVRTRGKQDLWIVNPDGTGERQLTDGEGSNFSPAASPDGRHIVFVSTRAGSPDLWRMDLSGEGVQRLTAQPGIEGEPEITPDGRWIIYEQADLNQQTTIWKISMDGGEPVQLTTIQSSRPEISPDGRYFACSYGEFRGGRVPQLAVIPIEGGEPISRHEMPKVLRSRNFRWSADGKGFVYIDTKDKIDNIWLQPLDGSSARQLTNFTSDGIKRFDIARDTGRLVFARFSESSDIVMISDFR